MVTADPPPPWWTPELEDLATFRFAVDLMGRDGYRPPDETPWVGCARCGGSLAGKRADARFCSHACRQAGWRQVRSGRAWSEADLVAFLRERERTPR